ncbi:MAG: hypothetical protein ACUZ8H_07345, partial [Candidatus Anammoxibacter sp.]
FVISATEKMPGFLANYTKRWTESSSMIGRLEKQPHSLIEILESFGETFNTDKIIATPKENVRHNDKAIMSEDVQRLLMKSEREYAERWGYA